MRILHIIPSLDTGGAETSLCSLIEATAGRGIDHTVVALLPGGVLRPRLERSGTTVIELAGVRGIAGALLISALARSVASTKPDIVHAWMYHANVASTILSYLDALRCPLIWAIRQSLSDVRLDRPLTRAMIRLGARLSRHPAAIVYNTTRAALDHEGIGYSPLRRRVISNGIDCDRFKPRPEARATLIAQLGLAQDATLIGRVARFSPMKDFDTMFRAFRTVRDALPSSRLLLVGENIDRANADLVSLCRKSGCMDSVHFLGPRLDVEQFYPALDVLVSSSRANEGFPNVVGEALASGTLVASTAVGDELLIQNGVHAAVPPQDSAALSVAITRLATLESSTKAELSVSGRRFIQSTFSITAFAERHDTIYRDLVR